MKVRKIGDTLKATHRLCVIILSIGLGVMILGAVMGFAAYRLELLRFTFYILGICALLLGAYAIAATIGLWLERIDIGKDSVSCRKGGRNHTVAKADIAKISLEKGAGVVLILNNGDRVVFADLGNATSICNILRSWHKKR